MLVVPSLSPGFIMANNARLSGTVQLAFKRVVDLSTGWRPAWVNEKKVIHLLERGKPNLEKVVSILRSMEGKQVAFDVETDGRHPLLCDMRCIAFYDGDKAITIPWLYRTGALDPMTEKPEWKHFWGVEHRARLITAMKKLFNNSTLLTQNGQYDRMVVKAQLGITVPSGTPHFDTMLGHHVIAPYLPHGLGFLSALYTDAPFYKEEAGGDAWSSSTDINLWTYNARDVITTWLIAQTMMKEVQELPQHPALYEQDAWQEAQCERWKETGVTVDRHALAFFRQHYRTIAGKALDAMKRVVQRRATSGGDAALAELVEKWRQELEKKEDEEVVFDADGSGRVVERFNPASLAQLRTMLRALDIPLEEKTATGMLSTAREVLTGIRKGLLNQKVSPDDDRIAFLDYLFAWRESSKVNGTYLYPEIINGKRGQRVHPTFSVHVVPTGRLSSQGPNCFSGDTELLTPSGWVRIDSWVKKPTEVAQWHQGNKLSWAKPLDVIEKTSQDWAHITSGHIDLKVTGEHRCPVTNRKGVFKVVEARDYPEDHKQQNAANGWAFEPGPLPLTDNALRLLIATQADGSWSKEALDFSLTKPRKVDRLRALLTDMGQSFTETARKPDSRTGSVATRFYVHSSPVLRTIKELIGAQKLFGPWVLQMNVPQREVFMREVMLWDGCATRMNHYASRHRSNADWVQTVFVTSGRRANVRVYRPARGAWGSQLSYQVDVSRTDYSWTTNRKLKRSTKSAPAYCLTVPSSFVLVRRNGKVMVSGQCQNQPPEIRGMFVADPGHLFVTGDWDALEMRLGAYNSQDPNFLKVFREYDAKTGPKPHIANMAVIFGLPATKESADANPGMYTAAKTFAYAVAYGAGEQTVFENSREAMPDLDFKTFKAALSNYKKFYARLFAYQNEVVQQGTQKGYLDSGILKRRVYFFEKVFGENSPEATAMQNFPYQSTGADVVGLANRRIMDRCIVPLRKKVKSGELLEQVAQVHDELLFISPERMVDEVKVGFKKHGEEEPKPGWVLPIDIKARKRWKPVQTRCKECREPTDVEMTQEHRWEGTCSKGHAVLVEVDPQYMYG